MLSDITCEAFGRGKRVYHDTTASRQSGMNALTMPDDGMRPAELRMNYRDQIMDEIDRFQTAAFDPSAMPRQIEVCMGHIDIEAARGTPARSSQGEWGKMHELPAEANRWAGLQQGEELFAMPPAEHPGGAA